MFSFLGFARTEFEEKIDTLVDYFQAEEKINTQMIELYSDWAILEQRYAEELLKLSSQVDKLLKPSSSVPAPSSAIKSIPLPAYISLLLRSVARNHHSLSEHLHPRNFNETKEKLKENRERSELILLAAKNMHAVGDGLEVEISKIQKEKEENDHDSVMQSKLSEELKGCHQKYARISKQLLSVQKECISLVFSLFSAVKDDISRVFVHYSSLIKNKEYDIHELLRDFDQEEPSRQGILSRLNNFNLKAIPNVEGYLFTTLGENAGSGNSSFHELTGPTYALDPLKEIKLSAQSAQLVKDSLLSISLLPTDPSRMYMFESEMNLPEGRESMCLLLAQISHNREFNYSGNQHRLDNVWKLSSQFIKACVGQGDFERLGRYMYFSQYFCSNSSDKVTYLWEKYQQEPAIKKSQFWVATMCYFIDQDSKRLKSVPLSNILISAYAKNKNILDYTFQKRQSTMDIIQEIIDQLNISISADSDRERKEIEGRGLESSRPEYVIKRPFDY